MSGVAVVTDTTHYMPRALVEALGLHQVSLYVTFEGETRREADIDDLDDFYRRLGDSSEMPSTSQPSVGDFMAVYEPLLEAGRPTRSLPLLGGGSGTPGTAEEAGGEKGGRGGGPAGLLALDVAPAGAGRGG